MKQVRAIFGFSVAFLIALTVVYTFSQAPFHATVKAWVPFYPGMPALPIYWYVAGAFGLGLALGLFWVVLTYLGLHGKLSRKNKETKELQREVARLQTAIDELRRPVPLAQPPSYAGSAPETPRSL